MKIKHYWHVQTYLSFTYSFIPILLVGFLLNSCGCESNDFTHNSFAYLMVTDHSGGLLHSCIIGQTPLSQDFSYISEEICLWPLYISGKLISPIIRSNNVKHRKLSKFDADFSWLISNWSHEFKWIFAMSSKMFDFK